MNTSGKGMKECHKDFLAWLHRTFGNRVYRLSVAEIGYRYGGLSNQVAFNYVRRLEKCGYVTLERVNHSKWIIWIDEEKTRKLLDGEVN